MGFKGFRYTLRADGKRQKTLSVPGTGLTFVEISKPGSSTTSDTEQTLKSAPSRANGTNLLTLVFVLIFLAAILLLLVSLVFR